MIEKCNFKHELNDGNFQCMLGRKCNGTIKDGGVLSIYECPGEKKCILYATYYEVEPEP